MFTCGALAAAAVLVAHAPVDAEIITPFTPPRFQANIAGTTWQIGNTLMTCPATDAKCATAQNGAYKNNDFVMRHVDVDGDPATFNSSIATHVVPVDGSVVFSGLYWGADTSAGSGGVAAPAPASRTTVQFTTPAGTSSVTGEVMGADPAPAGPRYVGFADVTALVAAGGAGEYGVANVQAGTGRDRYAGWAMVTVLADPNAPVRNITIYDGYAVVRDAPGEDSVDIAVGGFQTPPTGPVTTTIGAVSFEGDRSSTGDRMELDGVAIGDASNPPNNVFNSTISVRGSDLTPRSPRYVNQLGFDINKFDLTGRLANGATTATFGVSTGGETFFPAVLLFETDLFSPRLEIGKIGVDVNGGDVEVGDTIRYEKTVTNTGLDASTGTLLTDPVPAGTTYVPESIVLDGVPRTDAFDGDGGGFTPATATVTGTLGTGGVLAVGQSAVFSYEVVVDAVPTGSTIFNTATVSGTGQTTGLPVSAVSNAASTPVVARSDLSVDKRLVGTSPVLTPGDVTYRIVVTNRGPQADPGVTLADTLPAGLTATSVTASQGSCTGTAAITCDLGPMPVGAVAVVDVTATAPASPDTAVENTATATGGNLDPNPGDNTATALVDLDTNLPPVATDDAVTTPSDTPVTVPVLANDTDPDGDQVQVVGVGTPSAGTAVVHEDGTVTVTPPPGFSGDITVPYTIVDAFGQTSAATLTVTVTPIPPPPPLTPPLAGDDTFTTDPAAPTGRIPLDLLANDSDPDPGDTISITGMSTPANGTVVLSDDPVVCGTIAPPCPVYEPNPGFAGTDTFTYSITDTQGNTTTATVTITVPNDPPVPVPDQSATLGGTPVDVPVLLNDRGDPNGDTVTITGTSTPPNGTAVVNPDGTITYTPNPGFLGTDTFTYTVSDGNGGISTTTVTVTVFDNPPLAPPREETTPIDTPVTVDLLEDVTDPDGDTPRVVNVVDPPVGTITVTPDGQLTFTPPPGFTGDVPIRYVVTDGRGMTTEVEIVITVQPEPTPPTTPPPTPPPPTTPPPASPDTPSAAPPARPSGSLPITGSDALRLLLLAAALVMAGESLRRGARRRGRRST